MKDAPAELEVKFFPIITEDMRKKLARAGATLKTAKRFMRRCIFNEQANPGIRCTYIRVRDEGNKVTLSAKLHASGKDISGQKEYETIVSDFDTTCQILLNAGLEQSGYQENERETWRMPDGTLVELESWPELPSHLEIEGQSVEALQKTAVALGLQWDDYIVDSSDYLYSLHFGISREAALQKATHLAFKKKKGA